MKSLRAKQLAECRDGSPPRSRIRDPVGSWRAVQDPKSADQDPKSAAEDAPERAERAERVMVPYLITVMGKSGKLLLNIAPETKRKRELQLFFNRGRVDDGIQSTRSALRNMLSIEFNNIVCINAFKGYYLAVQPDHTDQDIPWYNTAPRYKSNIGSLQYVALEQIAMFANENQVVMGPRFVSYIDEVEQYFKLCSIVSAERAAGAQ